jgi:hypothetical protein
MRASLLLSVLALAVTPLGHASDRQGLEPGAQAPLMMGRWISEGKAPVLRGNAYLVSFWFDG